MNETSRRQFLLLGSGTILGCLTARAHDIHHHHGHHHSHFFTPHIRPVPSMGHVKVKSISVNAQINRQASLTKMVIEMENTHATQQEGQALIPVPHGAVLRKYTLDGVEGKFSAKLMPREEARRIYDSIVSQLKDPALLEFAGDGVVKSSVFPIPANGSVKLEIQYEMLLEQDGARIDYYIPRTQSLEYKIPWKVKVNWKTNQGIASVYSPSHPVETKNQGVGKVEVKSSGPMQPGTFRLSLLAKASKDASATFYCYPEAQGEGGHFLMLMSPPAPDKDAEKTKREVTIVFDKSGSMAGEKIDQVRAAALQVIDGLEDGEAFNIVVYNEAVEMFAPESVVKNRKSRKLALEYLRSIRVSGGTNIHGALSEAIKQSSRAKHLSLVLFLTDGVPTIGETNEKKIRSLVQQQNKQNKRIFCFGVGVDVNTPLLNGISNDTRAIASFVLPKENVELKVTQVFRRLKGPVLQMPDLSTIDAEGANVAEVSDMIPNKLNDMYYQDQVVLLGIYKKRKKIDFKLSGDSNSGKREFKFTMNTAKASNSHGFVPRLWATRKISILVEALRDMGADQAALDKNDPKVKELIDEVVRLSLRYGVLTEYTAFLAKEGTPIGRAGRDHQKLMDITADNFQMRALSKRSGIGSVNQEYNINKQKASACLDVHNTYWNAEMKKDNVAEVQQIGNKTYFRRGEKWEDSQGEAKQDESIVVIGTEEFSKLVDKLVKNNEQACLALRGDIRVSLMGKNYLIKK